MTTFRLPIVRLLIRTLCLNLVLLSAAQTSIIYTNEGDVLNVALFGITDASIKLFQDKRVRVEYACRDIYDRAIQERKT